MYASLGQYNYFLNSTQALKLQPKTFRVNKHQKDNVTGNKNGKVKSFKNLYMGCDIFMKSYGNMCSVVY